MVETPTSVLRWIGRSVLVLLLFCGCSSASSEGGSRGAIVNPWVAGGQTGALLPDCGLTPAARAGDSIPGGDSGIVIHTDQCIGFSAAALELHDEDGLMVAFDLEPLSGDAVLVRPRSPLPPGVYSLTIAGVRMESVVADEPAALPMTLGTLRPLAPQGCGGVGVELDVDPLLLEYLPQLKLSVSVDGEPDRTWFDYGTLDVQAGRATLLLPCASGQCLPDGAHTLRVTAELAGETGTLAPVEVDVEASCPQAQGAESGAGCSVSARPRTPAFGRGESLGLVIAALLLIGRRTRRSSA